VEKSGYELGMIYGLQPIITRFPSETGFRISPILLVQLSDGLAEDLEAAKALL
jgi:hypothetical protein